LLKGELLFLGIKRKLNAEGAALAGNAFHGNHATVFFDYFLNNGQTKTTAASLTGTRLIYPVKPVEYPR
jgi:hypothetical protein